VGNLFSTYSLKACGQIADETKCVWIIQAVIKVIILLCTCCLISSVAGARVIGNRESDLAYACGSLQDQYDILLIHYRTSSRSVDRAAIFHNIQSDENFWNKLECRNVYGNIGYLRDSTNAELLNNPFYKLTKP
jgi:hypothetical protein